MSRIEAWTILRSGSPTPLREVERVAAEGGLDDRDRALLRRLIGTEVRHRGTLRAVTRHYAHGKPSADLTAHLHVGLVQLLYLDRIPDHAALSETVDAVGRTLGLSKTRYVNAVLQAVRRARVEGDCDDPRRELIGSPWHLPEPVFRDPDTHPLLWAEDALSQPAHVLKRWEARHGRERAWGLARTFLNEPPLSLRVVRGEREALIEELAAAEIPTRPSAHPRMLRTTAEQTGAVAASAAFTEGRITIQGEHATRAAELMEAGEGEELLDLCAAPGGKTALLAQGGATVTAVDLDARRLERVAETARRLGLLERVIRVESDGTAGIGDATFDGVLVDAPCSNTGVLGARPGARWRFGPRTMASLGELQGRLLTEGAACVRPGGRLVWSTCSLEPEENEQLLARFLTGAGGAGWELEDEFTSLPAEDGPSDGGYAARLRRPRG